MSEYCAQLGLLLERRHTEQALITAKQQAERAAELAETAMRQAQEADRAKTKFLANMTHELRTPLNAIIGFSELIQNTPNQPQEHPAYAGYIYTSGTHLLSILNGVLDLARIEAGRLVLEQQLVSVEEITRSAALAVNAAAIERSITVIEALPADHIVWLDPAKIKRVLVNLLSNAIKFSAEGSTIELLSQIAPSGELVIAVRDCGCGIPPEFLDRVLEPFGQVEDHLTRETEGIGLGLPIARALTVLHGGDIRIASELGAGTTVSVHLPAGRVRSTETSLVA